MKELGELIRAARQQKGVTPETAAAETRIRRQYLGAIEDGDFRIFPGHAYATGFLHNYAAYLDLNPDDILQTYHALSPPIAINLTPATTVGAERLRRRSRRRFTWFFAMVLIIIIGAGAIKKYNPQVSSASNPPRLPFSTSGLSSPSPNIKRPGTHGVDAQSLHLSRSQLPVGVVGIRAMRTAWVHVVINHGQGYWGPIPAGTYREWSGQSVAVSAHRGTVLRVWVDGSFIGRMSAQNGRVAIRAYPKRWYRTG